MFSNLNFILLDAARMGEQMDKAKERNKKHDSLYRGGKEQSLFAVAPYIFQFSSPSAFSDWLVDKGWGDSWGVFFKSTWPLAEMHKHFRRFLLVNTEDGHQLYLRFYDPRVMRIFLPSCGTTQLREFFGPIDYFLVEDENPEYALRFRHENGILKTERLKFEDVFQRFGPEGAEEAEEKKELEKMLEEAGVTTEALSSEAVAKPMPAANSFEKAEPKQAIFEEEKPSEPIPQKAKTKWNMFD
ncbi:MAG: DUF4123 domain-containing protein [Chitinophagaceae bacterium]